MDLVSGSLTIVSTIIYLGNAVLQKYRCYHRASIESSELFVRFESCWHKIRTELSILQDISLHLDQELVDHFQNLLSILHQKLKTASCKLDAGAVRNTRCKSVRIKFAFRVRNPLVRSIEELETWNNGFQPSWYSMALSLRTKDLRTANGANLGDENFAGKLERLHEVVRKDSEQAEDSRQASIFVEDQALDRGTQRYIDCSASTFAMTGHELREPLIINVVEAPPNESSFVVNIEDLRDLGRKLSVVDPLTFGLLKCKGIVKTQDEAGELSECRFLFEVQSGMSEPLSLRNMLSNSPPLVLSERLHIARSLARAVMFVHNLDFVHKNIRPETIIVFRDQSVSLSWPFLLGFEEFRAINRTTSSKGTLPWEKNLYRHPSRQGINIVNKTHMQHDMFSLGICMLEIGLWKSFVQPEKQASSAFEAMPTSDSPCEDLPIGEILRWNDQRKKAWKIKEMLVSIAESELPARMGDLYAEVVLTCLNAWEDGNNRFGDKKSFMDSDGIVVGVRYAETIIMRLEAIAM